MSQSKDNLFDSFDDLSWLTPFEVEGPDAGDVAEPTYEDVDETGNSLAEAEKAKASLEPKNKLEEALLHVVRGTKRFASPKDRTRCHRIEDKCKPTEEGRLYLVWLRVAINWGKKMNATSNRVGYRDVMTMMENEDQFLQWKVKNADKVLKRPGKEALENQIAYEKSLQDRI